MARIDCSCTLFTLCVIEIVLIGVSINYICKYDNSLDYNKFKCNITRLEYPTEISDNVEDIKNKFCKCSCGKRCTSDLGICTKIFINVDNKEVLLKKSYNLFYNKCTFREDICANGELVENRLEAINKNIDSIEIYKQYIEKSELIDCYEYKNVYFLDNYNYFDEMVVLSCISILIILLIITMCICCPLR